LDRTLNERNDSYVMSEWETLIPFIPFWHCWRSYID